MTSTPLRHGDTPAGAVTFAVERFAQNIRDAMDTWRIERADIFGYSLGGYVALSLAAEFPDLVASVSTLGNKFAWTREVAVRETSRLDPVLIRAKVPTFAELLERLPLVASLLRDFLGAPPLMRVDKASRVET